MECEALGWEGGAGEGRLWRDHAVLSSRFGCTTFFGFRSQHQGLTPASRAGVQEAIWTGAVLSHRPEKNKDVLRTAVGAGRGPQPPLETSVGTGNRNCSL